MRYGSAWLGAAVLGCAGAPGFGGDYWVIENRSDKLFRIDVGTLRATEVGDLGVDWGFGGLGFAPDGTLYGVNGADRILFRIDTTTGAATPIGVHGVLGMDTFDISGSGDAIGWSTGGALYDVDLSTGDATLRVFTQPMANGVASAFGPAAFYWFDRNANRLGVVNVDTGAVTDIGPLGLSSGATNIGFNFADGFLYQVEIFDADYPMYRIDAATGSAMVMGNVVGMPADAFQQVTAGTFRADACPADFAPPEGVLDIFDILAFLGLFDAMDPLSDLAPPFGVFDAFDVIAYLQAFDDGCP